MILRVSVTPWHLLAGRSVTREQVKGAVILLGIALLFVAWRLWRSSPADRDRRAHRLRQERAGAPPGRAPGGEIVSCDSLQVYRGLDIGSAKAGADERRRVRHHLLDVVDPDQHFSAADYARPARAALDGDRRPRAPARGGRRHGPVPARAAGWALRGALARRRPAPPPGGPGANASATRGCTGCCARVDPEAAARIAPRDRVRVVRALEVYWTSGRTISEHQRGAAPAAAGLRRAA